MDKLIIRGGNPLHGEVEISGSKNAALPCLFATLLTDDECVLQNVPDLADIETACSLLTFLGKKVVRSGDSVAIGSGKSIYTEAPYELVRRMRASVLVLGPLLARTGRASASLPGGCAIGNRPINIHIQGFEKLGALARLAGGVVRLSAKKLTGGKILFPFPSVGATENLLMASSLSRGDTMIVNAAREPEIVDCCDLLKKMGVKIDGEGTGTIHVQGRKKLNGAVHRVIPDRIETATYLISAAVTKGKLKLTGVRPEQCKSILQKLLKAGLEIEINRKTSSGGLSSISCAYRKPIKSVSIVTAPYPGFPTDVQAQWMTLMSLAKGRSTIEESIFENRYLHAAELSRMGAQIKIHGNRAAILGVKNLSGADVMVSDLRAGAAMVLAGLAARGTTVIHRVYHLDRGYEKIEVKLRKVGADIKRVH